MDHEIHLVCFTVCAHETIACIAPPLLVPRRRLKAGVISVIYYNLLLSWPNYVFCFSYDRSTGIGTDKLVLLLIFCFRRVLFSYFLDVCSIPIFQPHYSTCVRLFLYVYWAYTCRHFTFNLITSTNICYEILL